MTGVQTCALPDRKSTRLNSSHTIISYAAFCLKKKHERAGGGAACQRPKQQLAPDRPGHDLLCGAHISSATRAGHYAIRYSSTFGHFFSGSRSAAILTLLPDPTPSE